MPGCSDRSVSGTKQHSLERIHKLLSHGGVPRPTLFRPRLRNGINVSSVLPLARRHICAAVAFCLSRRRCRGCLDCAGAAHQLPAERIYPCEQASFLSAAGSLLCQSLSSSSRRLAKCIQADCNTAAQTWGSAYARRPGPSFPYTPEPGIDPSRPFHTQRAKVQKATMQQAE